MKFSLLNFNQKETQRQRTISGYKSLINIRNPLICLMFSVSSGSSLPDDSNSLSPSGMDLTTSVTGTNEQQQHQHYRSEDHQQEQRILDNRRSKMITDSGYASNCNYHMYMNDMSTKDMIIRNPVQIPSTLPTITSSATTALSPHYAQRPLWNTINHVSTLPPPSTSPVTHVDQAVNPMMLDSPPSTLVLPTLKKRKRTPQPIPDECKDGAYWERRKRNNESAKRSREMRRVKEQQTNMRVIFLEQDNLRLKTEVTMLRNEVEKLRDLLYNRKDDNKMIQ
ncbi:cell death specification protein-like protein [Dinothrombium tinctorium]|uniref:Cell death specification protein-like protein n=1 Tax=Dinothrombium tinctorium TaxID=1965070 RepID=A0A3S3PJB3_9ACAR|nr:cell death specification protein-like protein [Dinothrombium tinctorium]